MKNVGNVRKTVGKFLFFKMGYIIAFCDRNYLIG